MEAKQYVVRAAKQMKLDLLKPTRSAPEILVMDWSTGSGKCVVDAKNWAEAKEQINKFAHSRF